MNESANFFKHASTDYSSRQIARRLRQALPPLTASPSHSKLMMVRLSLAARFPGRCGVYHQRIAMGEIISMKCGRSAIHDKCR